MRPLLPVLFLVPIASIARADGPSDPPDKGGTRPEALVLPSGAGSLSGMGEELSAEPATGALALMVPVVLPPGPPAVTPDLTLRYDSRAGGGPLGIGWSLGLPSVERRTDHGLPRYTDDDELLLAGQQLLETEPGVYRARVEGAFARVVAQAQGFRIDRRDGTKVFVGAGAESQVVDGGRVFQWLPARVIGVHGETATYAYTSDGPQRYLSEIAYGHAGAPPAVVRFRYTPRPDTVPDGRAGFLVPRSLRLAAIETFAGDPLAPVRRVSLSYDDSSGLSRLAAAETCAADGSVCLPTLTFETTRPNLAGASAVALAPPGAWLGDPTAALVDVDGDSLPDVVQLDGVTATWWRNLGPSGFSAGEVLPGAPGISLAASAAALQDMDGDGRADLLYALGTNGLDGIALAAFGMDGGVASMLEAMPLPTPAGLPIGLPSLRWLDLDGDGRVDALLGAPGQWIAWHNEGGGHLGPPLPVDAPAAGLDLSDSSVRLADMNGDGLVDLVRIASGSTEVFYSLGFGRFAAAVAYVGAPDVGGDDARLALGDADGDGLADVYYVAPGRVSLWRNLGSASFGAEIDIPGAPDYDPLTTTVRFADLLGSGTRGVVYSGGEAGAEFLWYLDPTGGVRPNLLDLTDNGVGGTRSVTYVSTGQLMAGAAAAGAPFSLAAPFPLVVVDSVAQSDGASPVEQELHGYRDAYWDPSERLFEGFATAEVDEVGDAHVDGARRMTAFHTGKGEDLALAGKPAVEQLRSWDGALVEEVDHVWVSQEAEAGRAGQRSTFAADISDTTVAWEGTSVPRSLRVRRSYDAHGNVLEEDHDGWLGASADGERFSAVLSYAENTEAWILGKLAERRVLGADGGLQRDDLHRYDGTAFEGLPLGRVLRGDEMRRSAWLSGDVYADTDTWQRDAFGNAVVAVDGDGRRTEIDDDPVRHLFAIGERQFPNRDVELSFEVTVDPATGEALAYTEADGAVTTYGYDSLGRLTSVGRPLDPPDAPGEQRQYLLTPEERAVVRSRRSQPGGDFDATTVKLFDGLLRPLAKAESAEDGLYAISGRVERDARGGVARTAVPYFSADPSAAPSGAWTEDFRDCLGRPSRRVLPAGGELQWVYAPGTVDELDSLASAGVAERTRTLLDLQGRPAVVVQDPGGANERSFQFERDAAGDVVARTSPLGFSTTATYDGLGRLVAMSDPDLGNQTQAFDLAGHLIGRTDAMGRTMSWTYDGAARVLSEADGAGAMATFCYDDDGRCGGSPSPGRLLSVVDRSGSETFSYDADGRTVADSVAQGGDALTTRFAYDGVDRLTELTYPDGMALAYQYGGRQLPVSIPGILETASYTASGLPVARTFVNGLTVQEDRDVADRVVEVSGAVSGTALVDIRDSLLSSGVPAEQTDLTGSTHLTLDAAERLTEEDGPFGQRFQGFDLEDRVFERQAVPADSRLPGDNLAYGVGAGPHAFAGSSSAAITYDAKGERTGEGALTLEWDAAGQLVAAGASGWGAIYVYGHDGSRRSRVVSYPDHQETSQSFGVYAELRDGKLWKHVFAAGERIATFIASE